MLELGDSEKRAHARTEPEGAWTERMLSDRLVREATRRMQASNQVAGSDGWRGVMLRWADMEIVRSYAKELREGVKKGTLPAIWGAMHAGSIRVATISLAVEQEEADLVEQLMVAWLQEAGHVLQDDSAILRALEGGQETAHLGAEIRHISVIAWTVDGASSAAETAHQVARDTCSGVGGGI